VCQKPSPTKEETLQLVELKGFIKMADPEGFEPSIPAKVYSLSRGALSTAQPQVQYFVERGGYEHLRPTSSMVRVLLVSLFFTHAQRTCERGIRTPNISKVISSKIGKRVLKIPRINTLSDPLKLG
jgi:hypothetical protein